MDLRGLVALCLFSACAFGNEQAVLTSEPSGNPTLIDNSPIPAIVTSTPTMDPTFGLDLMLGMMTGIRAEGVLTRGDHGSLRAEGFYGALFTKFGASEGAGAGF